MPPETTSVVRETTGNVVVVRSSASVGVPAAAPRPIGPAPGGAITPAPAGGGGLGPQTR